MSTNLLKQRALEFSLNFLPEDERARAIELIENNNTAIKLLSAHLAIEQAFKLVMKDCSPQARNVFVNEAISKLQELQELQETQTAESIAA